jgi:protein kinase A
LHRYPPFYAERPLQIYEKIVAGKVRYPLQFSRELRDLLKNLLQNDITRRFGELVNGVDDIKEHRWFTGLNWIQLYNKEIKPTFVPAVKGAGDASNYDEYPEEAIPTAITNEHAVEFDSF